MTNKEAAIILDGFNLRQAADKYDLEALDLAIDALKKQIPQKLTNVIVGQFDVRFGKCPNCGNLRIADHSFWKNNSPFYCERCGQLLDWSKEGND